MARPAGLDRRRLHLLANNARFLLLTGPGQLPNLASRALALCGARLSDDWQSACAHPIVAVESFVDAQLFRSTAYKAAGWHALGHTAGFTRVSEDFRVAHDRPRTLYVRPLHQRAAEPGSLWKQLHRAVPETRAAKGLRHKHATVLAITIAWLFTGQRGSHRAMALFAQSLTQTQRTRRRCWRNPKTKQYEVPAENCFYRVLTAQTLIQRLELDEMIAVLDALHTQIETARTLIQEQGAASCTGNTPRGHADRRARGIAPSQRSLRVCAATPLPPSPSPPPLPPNF